MNVFKQADNRDSSEGFQAMFALLGLGIASVLFLASIIIILFKLNIVIDAQWSGLMRLLVNSLFKMGYRRELVYEILEMYC